MIFEANKSRQALYDRLTACGLWGMSDAVLIAHTQMTPQRNSRIKLDVGAAG
jgi:hypothetical protein